MNIDLNKVYNSDCLEFLKSLPDNSIDSIVTDPPAGIAFMNKDWDKDKGGKKEWMSWMQSVMEECLRVLKPGGHALIWAIPKTSHWTANAVEDAGFEIRNKVYHLFGTGFPKSLDIGKAIDNHLNVQRDTIGTVKGMGKQNPQWNGTEGGRSENFFKPEYEKTANTSQEAKKYSGWGTDLKPASEEWIMARKPLEKGLSVAANVLKWGTGGINIDGCRIELQKFGEDSRLGGKGTWKTENAGRVLDGTINRIDVGSSVLGRFPANLILDDSEEIKEEFDKYAITKSGKVKGKKEAYQSNSMFFNGLTTENNQHGDQGSVARFFYCAKASVDDREEGLDGFEGKMLDTGIEGRFPANLILDDSEEVKAEFDKYGVSKTKRQYKPSMCAEDANTWGGTFQRNRGERGHTDEGTVARFFYCAKASVEDREEGLDVFEGKMLDTGREEGSIDGSNPRNRGAQTKRANHHPTVKNTSLMMYLCRLITPIDGIVLDPFSGSGSTGKAAILEGFSFVGCELDPEYVEIANTRIQYVISNKESLIKKYSKSVDGILPKEESISNKPKQITEFF